MKNALFTLFLLFTAIGFAQDSTNVKVEAPKIISKLQYNAPIAIEGITLEFKEVVSDSRCPKNVSCIWAGEAVVLIDVIKDGKKVEQKKLVFNTASQYKTELLNLFSSEELDITAYSISPYPVSGSKIKAEDYVISLDVRH